MKKILILLLFIFVTGSCFADIHRDSYFSKGIKVGNSSITVDNEGNIVVYPSLQIDGVTSQIYGEYGLGFNFDNDGYVQAYDNDTGLSTYLIYKECYGQSVFKTSITSSSFYRLNVFPTQTYKKVEFLTNSIKSNTGFITWLDNDSSVGSCFVVGKYGAGVYEIKAELEGTASSSVSCYAMIAINGVAVSNSNSFGYIATTGGRCNPSCKILLDVGDKVSLIFAKRGNNQNDYFDFRECNFELKRISQ